MLPPAAAAAISIPVRDEQRLLRRCLRAALRACRVAGRAGLPTVVVAVLHRCSDASEEVASDVRGGSGGALLVVHESGDTVGAARAHGAAVGLSWLGLLGVPAHRALVLSTDADSAVPPGWVLHHAGLLRGHAAVAGLVGLSGTPGSAVPAGYRQIIEAGLVRDAGGTGPARAHRHVYGANLGVRADGYLAAGGFPAVPVGEDVALWAAIRACDLPTVGSVGLPVLTSARRRGRVEGGLASLLARLDGGPRLGVTRLGGPLGGCTKWRPPESRAAEWGAAGHGEVRRPPTGPGAVEGRC